MRRLAVRRMEQWHGEEGCEETRGATDGSRRSRLEGDAARGRILLNKHGLPQNAQKRLLAALRMSGVRLENSFKNVGLHNFAFNKIQKASLPAEYRPPDVVLGGLVT